jgi:hypothetical protein
MQIFGNGHRVDIDYRYNSPYTKVSEEGQSKVYWVQIPYEKSFKVWNVVSDVIKNHGKDKDFWHILGDVLQSKFELFDVELTKNNKRITTKKTKKTQTQATQKVDAIASYAKVIYKGKMAEVSLYSDKGSDKITFERRKSWSHKKYVDKALELSGMHPSWDFRYGWEICS